MRGDEDQLAEPTFGPVTLHLEVTANPDAAPELPALLVVGPDAAPEIVGGGTQALNTEKAESALPPSRRPIGQAPLSVDRGHRQDLAPIRLSNGRIGKRQPNQILDLRHEAVELQARFVMTMTDQLVE
ncbi:MAG: hypothetical protein E6575_08415 [Bradyrhizobium sp.]|nr:hypothetical protein [Bradyrhizobium sp.]